MKMIKQEQHKELLSLYEQMVKWHGLYNTLSGAVISIEIDEEKNKQQIQSLQEIGNEISNIWDKVMPIIEDNKIVKEWMNDCGRINIEVFKQVVMSTLYDVKVIGLLNSNKDQYIKVRCNGNEDMWQIWRDKDESLYIINKDEKQPIK
jgi:hypothetical protein